MDSGARNIDHIITQSILPELSRQVLERISMSDPFGSVHMAVQKDGQFGFTFGRPKHP